MPLRGRTRFRQLGDGHHQRLVAAGVTTNQVQALWLKQALVARTITVVSGARPGVARLPGDIPAHCQSQIRTRNWLIPVPDAFLRHQFPGF
jgi:hypothetical protein